jgi:DNA-directed RNA polymerase sigma subunit (sigma70/sigma32)
MEEKKKTLKEVLADLRNSMTDREREVLDMRISLDEYEGQATVSRERIQEIEKGALEKLQARGKSMRTFEPVLDDE